MSGFGIVRAVLGCPVPDEIEHLNTGLVRYSDVHCAGLVKYSNGRFVSVNRRHSKTRQMTCSKETYVITPFKHKILQWGSKYRTSNHPNTSTIRVPDIFISGCQMAIAIFDWFGGHLVLSHSKTGPNIKFSATPERFTQK
jgi:hypothetical protein